MKEYTTKEVISNLPSRGLLPLTQSRYSPDDKYGTEGAMCAVCQMKDHTTDEGNQLQEGLSHAGYSLWGYGYPEPNNSPSVLSPITKVNPRALVIQDKREWDYKTQRRHFGDPRSQFLAYEKLQELDCVFKVTILKDSHQRPEYHRESAKEMGVHAWIVYYHPDIVEHTAGFVRKEHLIRTYHTIDLKQVPTLNHHRSGTVITGAISNAYPLRERLLEEQHKFPKMEIISHPGYDCKGTHSNLFLHVLNRYKVSICTCSRYGFALRKIIESLACGCQVVTDLPIDDVLPHVDQFLIRIHPDMSTQEVREVCEKAEKEWTYSKAVTASTITKIHYDYRKMGEELLYKINQLRENYNGC